MTALVLHRFPLGPFPYDRWLAELDGGVVLIAARDRIEGAREQVPDGDGGYRRLVVLDDFEDEELLDSTALELAEEYGITHVIAPHEADLMRAARLREKFGLPGQLPDEVLPFRDKALMKRRLEAAGIEVAPYALPATADDARDFADEHGLPLVFKARDGFGSIGLRIVRTPPSWRSTWPGPSPPARPPARTCWPRRTYRAGCATWTGSSWAAAP